jgi:cytochrome P450
MPLILVTSVEQLQDLYVNKTQHVTRHPSASVNWSYLMSKSVLFDQTSDPVYIAKRKELSGAFFKSKLLGMTKTIKEVTLHELKQIQDSGKSEIDIAKMTIDLQSMIIINVAIGTGYSKTTFDWENEDGTMTTRKLQDGFVTLI